MKTVELLKYSPFLYRIENVRI